MNDPTNLNSTWKSVLAISALLFNAAIIVLLLRYGDDKNSLHTSALQWSYLSELAIFAGLGFPYVLDVIKPKTGAQ